MQWGTRVSATGRVTRPGLRRPVFCLVAALVAVVLGAVAVAQATFGPRVTVSPLGTETDAPQVAVDDSGDAVATWRARDSDGSNLRIEATTISSADVLGPVHTLSSGGGFVFEPQVAIDADGDAIVFWYQQHDGDAYRVWARRISSSGVVGPPQALTPAVEQAIDVQVAIDDAAVGTAVAAWVSNDGSPGRIRARSMLTTGELRPTRTLSAPGANAIGPDVAVDADGDAIVAWSRAGRAQARRLSSADVLGPTQTLSVAGNPAFNPRIAVDDDGDAVAVWWRDDGTDEGTSFRAEARTISKTGALGTLRKLSGPGGDGLEPHVATYPGGDSIAVWLRDDGTTRRVHTRAISAAGVLGPVSTLSGAGVDAFSPSVAVGDSGDAIAVWERDDLTLSRVQARTISTAGVHGPVQTLSSGERDAFNIQVAAEPDADAIAIWRRFDGTTFRVQYSRGP